MNWIIALTWVVGRLKEPSSYAGLAGILSAYHIPHSGDLATQLAAVGVAVASIVAIFLPEKQ